MVPPTLNIAPSPPLKIMGSFFVCVFLLAPLKLKAALNQNTGDEPEIVLKLLKLVNCRPLALSPSKTL